MRLRSQLMRLFLGAIACSVIPTFSTAAIANSTPTLQQTEDWQLISYNNQPALSLLTINFDTEEEAFYGFDGCNQFWGHYRKISRATSPSVSNSTPQQNLTLMMHGTTLAGCVIDDQQAVTADSQTLYYTDLLSRVEGYHLSEDTLTLITPIGDLVHAIQTEETIAAVPSIEEKLAEQERLWLAEEGAMEEPSRPVRRIFPLLSINNPDRPLNR